MRSTICTPLGEKCVLHPPFWRSLNPVALQGVEQLHLRVSRYSLTLRTQTSCQAWVPLTQADLIWDPHQIQAGLAIE